ncbi:uncharacterized protein LOC123566061 [Mercenaria mercenaria]|uniref:uncharacterized protein LOC123566061 n=1 Tax=Mercenaria mercenaria TaxID=6596 RepID=UPI001E1D23B7|nr:uncharacterized protein LOC123566061 [Mercenaria mercenaria]
MTVSLLGTSVFVMIACLYVDSVTGHGRMIEPASRNSMWRFNYKNPRNYNDMGLNCGGFTNQFERHGGRCGVCGDPWEGPRENEAGGKYARGVVARQYKMGDYINVTVELTSNHQGYFEFRLCPVNNPLKKATHACLNRHLLNIVGHGTRYFITRKGASVYIELAVMLPPHLECSQCVLQWKWVAGQSMGPDGYGGECLGCGNQENFVNCADIAIGNKVVSPLPPLPGDSVTQQQAPAPTRTKAPARAQAPAAPAGPSYDIFNSGAGNGPNMELVKQIVSKLAQTLLAHGMPTTTKSWRTPQVPRAPATEKPWNRPPPSPSTQQQWQPTPSPQNWGPSPTPQPASWQTRPQETYGWTDASSSHHVTESPASNFPGYEPGEYPEPGEGPSSGSNSGSSSSNSGQSSYMQGFNDAMRQIKNSFGNGAPNNNVFNEISVHLQESQKNTAPQNYGGGSMPATCPDGSEFECTAKNSVPGSDFDSFCNNACNTGQPGQCPTNMCACTCPGGESWSGPASMSGGNCVAVDKSKGSSMDQWCVSNCKQNNCPPDLCTCH